VDEFVSSWFRHLSPDEEFVQEIRILLRDVTQDLLIRLAKVSGKVFVKEIRLLLRDIKQDLLIRLTKVSDKVFI
jgi:PXA domain